MQSPTFNFAQHHQFDDMPDDEASPERETTTSLNPRPSVLSSQLPRSSSSLIDGFSDYSPSPSVASVRMAQLVTRLPSRRTVSVAGASSRLSIDTNQSSTTSGDTVDDIEQEEEGTVWDARLLKQPQRMATPHFSTRVIGPVGGGAGKGAQQESAEGGAKVAVDAFRLEVSSAAEETGKGRAMPTSASNDSVASWRGNLDAAVREMSPGDDTDPALRPEVDAMMRMKSILGRSSFLPYVRTAVADVLLFRQDLR
jgi:hypothetical protein